MAKKKSAKISKHQAKKRARQAAAALRGCTLPDHFEKVPVISWYPGHMLKAQREIREKLKLVDIVIELVDSRIPAASLNPIFDPIFENKPRLLVLNKCALADPIKTDEWIAFFEERGRDAIAVDALTKKNISKLIPKILEVMDKSEKRKKFRLSTRCMIVGVPNVGKSTLINRLARKKIATTGPRPGVTKKQQWVQLQNDVELLDTPGILYPRIDTKADELNLALTANIKDDLVGQQITAEYLLYLLKAYSKQLVLDVPDELWEPDDLDYEAILASFAEKRNFLAVDGELDVKKSAVTLLNLFREGKMPPLTLDRPEDLVEKERVAALEVELGYDNPENFAPGGKYYQE